MNSKISSLRSWDDRRTLAIPGDHATTVHFFIQHILALYQQAVKDHGFFYLVLSGGSTPKELYEILCASPYKEQIDWRKVYLFWGDERAVPPTDPKSNYHMAMDAGFKRMSIPAHQIQRMHAEEKIEENALAYEQKIKEIRQPFDLIILGCGEDGHTASLFPHTKALKAQNRLVVANEVPQLQTKRMTLTFECINQASNSVIYALGAAKKEIIAKVLQAPTQIDLYPIQGIGTPAHKALWLLDQDAASLI